MNFHVIVPEIIQQVVSEMKVPGISSINYQVGRVSQIIQNLAEIDNSRTLKGKKYPLIALLIPIVESRGSGFYATVRIPRIVISTLTSTGDGNVKVIDKYHETDTYKKVLYPCYYEFLRCLSRSPSIATSDPDFFTHDKVDNPSIQPIGEGLNDYIDSIEIMNLEFSLIQFKNCK